MRVRSTMADSDCLDDHDLGENRVIVRKIAKRRHCCCQAAREKAKVLPNMVLAINMVEKWLIAIEGNLVELCNAIEGNLSL